LHRICFPEDPWDAEAMARVLGLSGCFGRLAWEGGEPCGFVLARDLGDECEILSVGVEPAARGRGIGTRLMAAALAEARRRGAASVVLEVAADNEAARRLYAGLGFARVGHRPRYYRRPDGLADALILRVSLGDSPESL
jgi:ribosomal-protein-alanine N-acetyltransferase